MGKVTSLDVAEKAGVSRSAVSRVFTPGASVSKRTAEKVRSAAAALGYRPNVLARSLNTGRSRIVGLVVAYLQNQFYPEAIEKLSKALQAEGYHMLVFMASNDHAATQSVIDELLDYQVDAIIAASVGLSNDLTRRCEGLGIPLVLFNRHQNDSKACFQYVYKPTASGLCICNFSDRCSGNRSDRSASKIRNNPL